MQIVEIMINNASRKLQQSKLSNYFDDYDQENEFNLFDNVQTLSFFFGWVNNQILNTKCEIRHAKILTEFHARKL